MRLYRPSSMTAWAVLLATAGRATVSRRASAASALVGAFTPSFTTTSRTTTRTFTRSSIIQKAESDDDWYADFNPDDFKDYNKGSDGTYSPGSAGRGDRAGADRGGGGGGGGGRASYDDYNGGGGGRGGGGRGGGGGGGGGYQRGSGGDNDHDYTRDTSRDTSNVDESAVNSLLSERLQAKFDRNFDTADNIRDQLLADFGVQVWDREKTWRTGASASGSGMGRPGSGGNNRERGGGGRRQRDFGPTGHDYDMCSDAGPIQSDYDEGQINELLAERLQCKMSRDFRNADRIQEDLIRGGVFVHDARKEWRADGTMFGDLGNSGGRPGRESGSRSDRNRDYQQSEHSDASGIAPEDVAQVQDLVSERAGAKMKRDYRLADDIREELRNDWNVLIDDRARMWSVGGDFGPDYAGPATAQDKPYSQSEYSQSLEDPSKEEYIVDAINKRSQAKKDRNFAVADAIRDELEADYNVNMNDRIREWSVGGDFGTEQANSRNERNRSWSRRGGGELSEAEIAVVSTMLEERMAAKKDRDFNTADQIRDDLNSNFQVKVDDKSMEWRVMSDTYVLSTVDSGNCNFDEGTIALVQSKLAQRMEAKARKDYDIADDIRDELSDTYGVTVDDRTREWSVETPRGYGQQAADEPERAPQEPAQVEMEEDVAVEVEASTGDDAELSSLTVVELKEKLRVAGLAVSGKKSELIERLQSA